MGVLDIGVGFLTRNLHLHGIVRLNSYFRVVARTEADRATNEEAEGGRYQPKEQAKIHFGPFPVQTGFGNI